MLRWGAKKAIKGLAKAGEAITAGAGAVKGFVKRITGGVAEQAGKRAAEEATQQAGKAAAEQAGKQAAEEASQQAGKAAAEQAGKQAAEEAGQQAGKETTQQAAKEIAKEIEEQAATATTPFARESLVREPIHGPRARFPDNEAQVRHIFRDAPGHLPDTSANRQLLPSVANDATATLGTDKFGNVWSARINPDGTQTWVQSRNGVIINGGVNQTPRAFNPQTGLSSPVRPR
jgi:hypothetical protein